MKIIKNLKKIIIKIDNFREEKVEDFIADSILSKLDGNTKVDELEKKAILAGITAASAYASTYGLPACPESIKEKIADECVKTLGKANKLLQKQLKKKSKAYQKRNAKAEVVEG